MPQKRERERTNTQLLSLIWEGYLPFVTTQVVNISVGSLCFCTLLIVEQVKEVKYGLFPFLGCLWGSLTSKEHIIFQKTQLKRILYNT